LYVGQSAGWQNAADKPIEGGFTLALRKELARQVALCTCIIDDEPRLKYHFHLDLPEWLINREYQFPEKLLNRFAKCYAPWRRYGSGTEMILRVYPEHKAEWRQLATAMFVYGSFGNGSAMRAAPIGLAFSSDLTAAIAISTESSRPTHSHPLAYQGAGLQTIAVAIANASDEVEVASFLRPMRASLQTYCENLQDTSKFTHALELVEKGIAAGTSCGEMAVKLGTGIEADSSVPLALYCFLRHHDSFERVIHEAVFAGGDTDTIAGMAGSIAGAFLGSQAIPSRWIGAIRDEEYAANTIVSIADRLFARFGECR
jgi:poly(ADP-ribose) glycohydrolase ARH3